MSEKGKKDVVKAYQPGMLGSTAGPIPRIKKMKKLIARRKTIYLKEVEKAKLRGQLAAKIDEKEILDCEIEKLKAKLEELEKEQ